MDDESGEFTDRAEVTSVGRSESEMERSRKFRVDSRDEVRHNEKTDQLFVKMTMNVDEKE